MTKIGMISLGCPRNLVDSEVMLGILKKKGYRITEKIDSCDVAIVNTCAFIRDAADESIETILGLARLKKERKIKKIIVAGCLPQRYKKDLKKSLTEVDRFIGTGDVANIDSVIVKAIGGQKAFTVSARPAFVYDHTYSRDPIAYSHSVYVKIQEGCANRCTYCVIPDLRGDLRSRPIASILEEVKGFSERGGISEINIIGQDTTAYGYDLSGKSLTAGLLGKIAGSRPARWIRLLYTHPAHWTDELIRVIRDEPAICKYVDLPIQHVSDKILKKMGRNTTSLSISALIERLKKNIPGLALRSTVMVGFPGETESDFLKLLDFVKETRFERLGAFIYSNEEGSPSFRFDKQIPDRVKKERLDHIMMLQQSISIEYNKALLGRMVEVLIDERDERGKGVFIGRTAHDAPSVDGQVYVKGKDLHIGDFVKVRITDTFEYDLVGEVI